MRTPLLPVLLVLALPIPAAAHEQLLVAQAGKTKAPSAKPRKVHTIEKVAEDVYAIFGEGGNIGLVVGERFCVLIDAQFEPLVPGLLEVIRSVTPKPVKYLVNTHHHGDHTGGNRALAGQVQVLLAHVNAARNLAKQQEALEPAKRGGLPELVFGEEDPKAKARLDVHLGNLDLHVVHRAEAHTDGDVMIGVPQRHVLHAGDVFFNGLVPFIDTSSGGSLAGTLENVEYLLSFIPDDTRVIPGHGPVGGKADLVRYRDFLAAVQRHVAANPGKAGAELAASFDREPFPGITDMPGFLSWAGFFDLAAGRMPQRPK